MSTEHSEPQTVVEKVPIQLLQTTRDHDDTTWTFNPEFLRKLVAGPGISSEGNVAMGFNGPLEAMIVYNVSDPRQRGVLMPIRCSEEHKDD